MPAGDTGFTILRREVMRLPRFPSLPAQQEGKAGYVLMWLLGIPIPILLLVFLLRGCN